MGYTLGKELKKLGFGFMRIPMNGELADYEQVNQMVDNFIEKGFTYFDTAYVYLGGESENALKKCLIERYPRDKFQIADKLPMNGDKVETWEDMIRVFNESLERTNAKFFDFYLLHALNKNNFVKSENIKAWDFITQMKTQGKIKHIGFSFHDSADVLDDILTKHPEVEFVQLQLNYYDWENIDVQSRACHEVALKHNKTIIVMEPIKGGNLVNLPKEAYELLKENNPTASTASWAIRFAASLDNVAVVLSGMSTLEQANDNISYMDNFVPVTDKEIQLLNAVTNEINKIPTIGCTSCQYCVEDCPMSINIPELFKVMNHHKRFDESDDIVGNSFKFVVATRNRGLPSQCLECGLCEGHCPQKINIIEQLKHITKVYER